MDIMNTMMLSCVKATELMEMKKHVHLSFIKTMQLHMHTAMCSGCRNYMKQSSLINNLLQNKFNTLIRVQDTDELEKTILKNLR